MAGRLDPDRVHAYAILPRDRAGIEVADFARSVGVSDADRVLGKILQALSAISDGILVVDDDLARRGDPGLDDVSFVDDRVIRWLDLRSAPDELTRLIRIGASGYPLNAFICDNSSGEAFRPSARSLSESEVDLLAGEVRLVIHSIFDAESFLLLAIDDGIEELLESITSSVDPPP
ncbi:hypothetical protein KV395_00545 [Microbacterium luteolum]|uniref:Uncharacterized protein n=1 Tax=Microbacterium luteolum TaxID=69367 RepID=A0ABY7XIA7_MICLT|nr:hypothetical protein [Microbacterium luteolum]WDM41844.1 hypothetical protein KV395_00545 [Microbacterium luteolum]